MRCTGDIESLDGALAALAREESALRLQLGQVLEAMGRGAVLDLGFSSLGAYAVERCERSERWAEGARGLARQLERLPALRRAVAIGKVSWSMAQLLARVATPADEARWLERAESRTVRQVRLLVGEATTATRDASTSGAAAHGGCMEEDVPSALAEETSPAVDDSLGNLHRGVGDEVCTLTCTVNREDAWLFEATRYLLEQLGAHGPVAQCEALLAESQSTLLALLPERTIDLDALKSCDLAQQRWVQQLRRWRDGAEASCEKKVLGELLATRAVGSEPAARRLTVVLAASLGIAALEHASCTTLDQRVRALTAALAGHELELSLLVLQLHRADGWRRLGYATETQYARERLGLSRSSLLARRTLALRLERLPRVAAALGAAQIGVEAALQLVRIATSKTESAWIERARRRTIKHLREEVTAALTAVRLSGESDCPPPEDTEMAGFQALEQAVLSGRFAQSGPVHHGSSTSASQATRLHAVSELTSPARRAWWGMLGSLASWLDGRLQTSAAAPSAVAGRACSFAGRVTLRLRMSRETYVWWRCLEAQFRRWLPSSVSWVRFLCLCVWNAWRHLLGADVAYGRIYVRDRFRCTSPVCNRRDVTPHHLKFRSAGGSDEDYNVTGICTWCHLCGVHRGRIRARGTAAHIHWELGPRNSPCVTVHGRDRGADRLALAR